jgi:hypothetical protein
MTYGEWKALAFRACWRRQWLRVPALFIVVLAVALGVLVHATLERWHGESFSTKAWIADGDVRTHEVRLIDFSGGGSYVSDRGPCVWFDYIEHARRYSREVRFKYEATGLGEAPQRFPFKPPPAPELDVPGLAEINKAVALAFAGSPLGKEFAGAFAQTVSAPGGRLVVKRVRWGAVAVAAGGWLMVPVGLGGLVAMLVPSREELRRFRSGIRECVRCRYPVESSVCPECGTRQV